LINLPKVKYSPWGENSPNLVTLLTVHPNHLGEFKRWKLTKISANKQLVEKATSPSDNGRAVPTNYLVRRNTGARSDLPEKISFQDQKKIL
jgi:hypothetical protein